MSWPIPLLDGEAQHFGQAMTPLVPASRLASAVTQLRVGPSQVDVLGQDGACVALSPEAACLLHASRGPEAKPVGCRVYPLQFVRTPDAEVRVSAAFTCPAVVAGAGPPLEEQREELTRFVDTVVRGSAFELRLPTELALHAEVRVAWHDAAPLLEAVADAFAVEAPLPVRCARALATLHLASLHLAQGRSVSEALRRMLDAREPLVAEVVARAPEVDRLSRGLFRALVGAAHRERASSRPRLAELVGVLGALVGVGAGPEVQLPLRVPRLEARSLSPKALSRVRGALPVDGEALLVRRAQTALGALSYFGPAAHGLTVAAGLELLLVELAIAVYAARAAAADAHRRTLLGSDVALGVSWAAVLSQSGELPAGLGRSLEQTAGLDLLRAQLEAG